jgi:hypothetical protein
MASKIEVRKVVGYSPPWAVLTPLGLYSLSWTREDARESAKGLRKRIKHGEVIVRSERGWCDCSSAAH